MSADNPGAYFRMNDTGSTMENVVPDRPEGTHQNGPLLGVESALINDTSDRSVGYRDGGNPDRSKFVVGSVSDFSLEFFMKTNQTVGAGVNNWYDGFGLVDAEVTGVTSDAGTALVGGGKVGFGIGSPDITIKSTTTVNDFNWHHVVATWDAGFGEPNGTMKLYVDGNLEAQSTAHPGGSRNAAAGFTVGSLATNILEFAGAIDEVAYYPHVLPASDVSEHYAARNDPPPGPPPRQITVLANVFGGGSGKLIGTDGVDCPPTCSATSPEGAVNDYEALAYDGSRFGGYFANGDGTTDCFVVSATRCTLTADHPAGSETINAAFFPTANTLGNSLNTANNAVGQGLENAIDGIVNPKKKKKTKFKGIPVGIPTLGTTGTGAADLLVGIDKSKVKLLGSDGATVTTKSIGSLLGSDGATVIQKVKSALQNGNSGKLLGSDGATLVGNAGNTLIGSDGASRPTISRAGKAKEYEVFSLGGYETELTGSDTAQVTFEYSPMGRKIIKHLAQQNLASKKVFPLNTTFIDLIQPADGQGTGGSYEDVKIK